MTQSLVTTETAIGTVLANNGSEVISQKALEKIYERLPELARAKKSIGRKNSQTTSTLMTLTMIADGPFRQMKQCLSQIGNKKDALISAHFKIQKQKVNIKKWDKEQGEMKRVLAAEARANIIRVRESAEQALKEMGMYQDLYDKIREENNIPADWDEADYEEAEVANHLHLAFRQAVQDVVVHGSISKGIAEYLEQYGVNQQEQCKEKNYPSVKEMHKFLDLMADTFKDEHKHCLSRMGVDKIVSADYIYREGEKK